MSAQDTGYRPAVFVILLLCLIVVGLAALVEIQFGPTVWVYRAIRMLRPTKAGLSALQYPHHLPGAPPPC